MIEYIASFLAGALVMCIGFIAFLLRRRKTQPVVEQEEGHEPPLHLPDYDHDAETEVQHAPIDPHPDDDNYVDEYNRQSERERQEFERLKGL